MVGLPRFVDLQRNAVECDDPERLLWYGLCGYWTDDWQKLSQTSGALKIPACPQCNRPGFQMRWCEWFEGVDKFQSVGGNEGYHKYLTEYLRERCLGKPMDSGCMLCAFRNWQKQNGFRKPALTMQMTATETIALIGGVECRQWMGVTPDGIKCHVFVHRIAVHRDEDTQAFERELLEKMPPASPPVDLRHVL